MRRELSTNCIFRILFRNLTPTSKSWPLVMRRALLWCQLTKPFLIVFLETDPIRFVENFTSAREIFKIFLLTWISHSIFLLLVSICFSFNIRSSLEVTKGHLYLWLWEIHINVKYPLVTFGQGETLLNYHLLYQKLIMFWNLGYVQKKLKS